MKHMKKLLLVSMVAAASNALAAPIVLPTALTDQLIVAETYVSMGALSVAHGNIQSGTYSSIGAGITGAANPLVAVVHGNINSGGYTSLGDSSIVDGNISAKDYVTTGAYGQVGGNVESGDVVTLGANSVVGGNVAHGTTFSLGSGASVAGSTTFTAGVAPAPAASLQSTIMAEQAALKALTGGTNYATGGSSTFGTAGASFNAGVHNVDDILSFTANTTVTLVGDGSDQHWVFNIGNYMEMGANVDVVLQNAGPNSTVIWNILGDKTGAPPASTLGYASLGAGVDFIGTVLANAYISVGADDALVDGGSSFCGGLYSAQSYVSVGATSVVGGDGCTSGPSAVPIPAAAWLFGSALFGLVGVARRKKA